jgi:hypothetical protein
MASLPQLLHPCCCCYCATAHRATPHCAPPCCCLCSRCQRRPFIHAHGTMLVPPFSSPRCSPAPPLILLPPQPPHCRMGGGEDVPSVVVEMDGGGQGAAGDGGQEKCPHHAVAVCRGNLLGHQQIRGTEMRRWRGHRGEGGRLQRRQQCCPMMAHVVVFIAKIAIIGHAEEDRPHQGRRTTLLLALVLLCPTPCP